MPDINTWVDEQVNHALFSLRSGQNMLEKFVQVGKANRIISVPQARLLVRDRTIAAYMGWPWLTEHCDNVEDYQLTIGWPENSRSQLLDAVRFERWAQHDKGKGSISVATDERGKA